MAEFFIYIVVWRKSMTGMKGSTGFNYTKENANKSEPSPFQHTKLSTTLWFRLKKYPRRNTVIRVSTENLGIVHGGTKTHLSSLSHSSIRPPTSRSSFAFSSLQKEKNVNGLSSLAGCLKFRSEIWWVGMWFWKFWNVCCLIISLIACNPVWA